MTTAERMERDAQRVAESQHAQRVGLGAVLVPLALMIGVPAVYILLHWRG